MKKLSIIGAVAAVLLAGVLISIPLVINYTAYKVEKKLRETPLPEKTELIDSVSNAGKFTGNGNGMQYFGAILIESELSLEELESYYSDYREKEWEYIVAIQEGQKIETFGHGKLKFSKEADEKGNYMVYSWGDGIPFFADVDIRGH